MWREYEFREEKEYVGERGYGVLKGNGELMVDLLGKEGKSGYVMRGGRM